MATSASLPSASFTTALSNVRRLTSSPLAHQSRPAQLLVAVESTIALTLSAPPPYTATAYFASLLQCLTKAIQSDADMGPGGLVPAVLYLLAVVVPQTLPSVIQSKVSSLIADLLPLTTAALDHPPALRSLIQIITAIMLSAPAPSLNSSSMRGAWNSMLELNLDPRPKVRHLAQEGIRKVLDPTSRELPASHTYVVNAREWAIGHLQSELQGNSSGKKRARFQGDDDEEAKKAIWIIQGLKGWSSSSLWANEVGLRVDLSRGTKS